MARNLFSVPIFFIVFRETIEAAIIVSVLLGLVEQIVRENNGGKSDGDTTFGVLSQNTEEKEKQETTISNSIVVPNLKSATTTSRTLSAGSVSSDLPIADDGASDVVQTKRLIRKLRIQIFLGAGIGFFLALSIGAAFIAVWFTQAANLWNNTEELWEGTFELIASIIIFVMGITMLKMDRAKAKWRVKLQRAFAQRASKSSSSPSNSSTPSPFRFLQKLNPMSLFSRSKPQTEEERELAVATRQGLTGKYILLILPLITVLREGMEAIIFVGGVALGQPAVSIPIAAIVGLVCGVVVGVIIYAFASRSTLTMFLVLMTNLLLLIGAGLFSRAVGAYQENAFNNIVGFDADDVTAAGNGPGSYNVIGNVWHLDCCNPEDNLDGEGWSIFNAILGWTNSATLGTILSYIFYWLSAVVVLITMKYREGRTNIFGYESAAGGRRREIKEKKDSEGAYDIDTVRDSGDKDDDNVSSDEKGSSERSELADGIQVAGRRQGDIEVVNDI